MAHQSSTAALYTAKRGIHNTENDGGNGHNHSARSQLTGRNLAHAHRTASQRGAVAAQLVLEEVEHRKPTILQAAAITGANVPYVHFCLRLKPETRARVAAGEITIAEAAKANGLLEAYLDATKTTKAALGVAVGIDEIWDNVISPSLD